MFFFSGDSSFYACTSLTQIVLTSGLVQIGPGIRIFQQSAVRSLIIPSSVTAMGEFRIININFFMIINIIIINNIY